MIKFRYSGLSEIEVKVTCPVCRGECSCEACSPCGTKEIVVKVCLFLGYISALQLLTIMPPNPDRCLITLYFICSYASGNGKW